MEYSTPHKNVSRTGIGNHNFRFHKRAVIINLNSRKVVRRVTSH